METGPLRRLSLEERRQLEVPDHQVMKTPISPRNRDLIEEDREARVRRWSLEEFRALKKYSAPTVMQYPVQRVPIPYTQPTVPSVCQVQPIQVLPSGKYRSGSFESVPVERMNSLAQSQCGQQRIGEGNEWVDEVDHIPINYTQDYEPVIYNQVVTQYQPYQPIPGTQPVITQGYHTSPSIQTRYPQVPMQSYPNQVVQTVYSSLPMQHYSQQVPGQVLQPVLEDHLHKPLQAVQPIQYHMQDMYSMQQHSVQPVIQYIETQPNTPAAPSDQKPFVNKPATHIPTHALTHTATHTTTPTPTHTVTHTPTHEAQNTDTNTQPDEPVRVRKVSFQDETNEDKVEDEPYVGLRRLRRTKQSKSMDSDESHEEPKPAKGILQRKSRSMSESNVGTGKVRRNSMCPMTAYNLRGSSTVAIDNKIEQAMDLVKSHLMFAVREEVEVLKEQIAELIERNNQLEYENGILRAAASPETLAKLAQPRQPPASSSS